MKFFLNDYRKKMRICEISSLYVSSVQGSNGPLVLE